MTQIAPRMRRLIETIHESVIDSADDGAKPILHETHGAVVLLAGDRAFKIKKPVGFAYMDFSTLEKRRYAAEREVAINRRTAPETYLGVGAVVARGTRWRFVEDLEQTDPEERLVEPVVVMRRFAEDGLLDHVARSQGALSAEICDALAFEVADFHARARCHRAVAGSRRVADVLEINANGLRAAVPGVLGRRDVEDLIAASRTRAAALGSRLDRRARSGRVRRCHGDLHLRNIFLDEGGGGAPRLFDAIEFDEALATTDVAYDLAFLLMDLWHRGLEREASRVWNGWLSASRDDGAAAVIDLFLSMRAAVRAHVSGALARQHPEDPGPKADAAAYLDLAREMLRPKPPVVVAIGGISGTGKTTLARAVAGRLGRAPGAVILRSDVIRKQRWGVGETERLPREAYTATVSARVFAEINRRAGAVAGGGQAVVADAVFGLPVQRRRIAAVASRRRIRFLGFWLTVEVGAAEARVAARRGDASDATPRVVRAQAGGVIPPDDWWHLDAGSDPEALALEILRRVQADPA